MDFFINTLEIYECFFKKYILFQKKDLQIATPLQQIKPVNHFEDSIKVAILNFSIVLGITTF